MNRVFSIAVACGIALAAGTAGAGTITFDTVKDFTSGSLSFSDGTDSVSVSAGTYVDGVALPSVEGASNIGSDVDGLVVCTGAVSGANCPNGDWRAVDSKNGNELVLFDFGQTVVSLTSITLTSVDNNDVVDVFAFGNGALVAATEESADLGPQGGSTCMTCTLTGFSFQNGSLFGIGASTPSTAWQASNFKISALQFDVISRPLQKSASFAATPSPVPVPASLPLLLSVLGGFGALSLRQRKNRKS